VGFYYHEGNDRTSFKARLVARGYEDAEKENISSDSPVASAAAQQLVLAACAECQWIPHSWDFSTAFLQGKYIDRKRDIAIAPPDGYVAAGIAWRLKISVYGLCSALKSWYDRVREVATAAGLVCDVSDEAAFRLFDSTGSVIGILALHVDDTIGGDTLALFDAMRLIGSILKIGAEESAKDGPFWYADFRISTCPITHGKHKGKVAITMDGGEYVQATKEMDAFSGDANDLLFPAAATEFRSVAGCIGYMALFPVSSNQSFCNHIEVSKASVRDKSSPVFDEEQTLLTFRDSQQIQAHT
jgi:Reverse transcriptase (RNA-dependent DNA polymerase)